MPGHMQVTGFSVGLGVKARGLKQLTRVWLISLALAGSAVTSSSSQAAHECQAFRFLFKRFTMLSGFKGVKYGLTVPKKEAKPGVKKPLAVFADGDSDEDEQSKVAKDIERQAQRKQSNAKVLFAVSSFAELTGGLHQSNLSCSPLVGCSRP